MALTLSTFLALAPTDRATYFHDTLVQSELKALRASAVGIIGAETAIVDAMNGAMAICKTAADAAATSASNAVYATYYARLAAG